MKDEIRKRNDDGWQLLQMVVTSMSGAAGGTFMVANGFELIFVREAQ
jgi:hypothetical protein